jgi:hypothetical protein
MAGFHRLRHCAQHCAPVRKRLRRCLPGARRIVVGLFVLSLLFLAYVAGAAALFLDLPTADFLRKAFTAALALNQREFQTPDPGPTGDLLLDVAVTTYDARRTFDGFTLVTTTEATRATLLDMRGKVVHRWELPFSQAWPHAPHVRRPISDSQVHWFRCYLFPDGELLAVYHASGDTPYGYGLARLDRDSRVVWTFSENVHHDVDVGEDGTIVTLTQRYVDPPPGAPKTNSKRLLADYLVVLSPEGKKLKEIPVLEAFRDSPFAPLLSTVDRPISKGSPPDAISPVGFAVGDLQTLFALAPLPHDPYAGDLLHVNSVKVLRQSRAARFPLFQAGDVLVSLRNLDVLAMLNLDSGRVVWAARGPWRRQHDPSFLDNGRLLVYDNLGSLAHSRVLEYDPGTQAVEWCYSGENGTSFHAFLRGTAQRLDNGNTLIVEPDEQRIFEVTPDRQRVWECCCPVRPTTDPSVSFHCAITGARRYNRDLPFLKGATRARP